MYKPRQRHSYTMVVVDRLREMQSASKQRAEGEEQGSTTIGSRIRDSWTFMGHLARKRNGHLEEMMPLKEESTNSFLVVVEEINADIDHVRDIVNKMKITQNCILKEPSRSERNRLLSEHTSYLTENRSLGQKIQRVLRREQETSDNSRIRKIQIETASSKFMSIWTKYNTLQVEFRNKLKKELEVGQKMSNVYLTKEETEEKLDHGDVSVLGLSSIQETQAAREQLAAVENRDLEIQKLERGIEDIYKLFTEMQQLVLSQGEKLNRIEDNIDRGAADVEKGVMALREASRLRASTRKKVIILGSVFGLVLFLLLLGLLSTPSRGSDKMPETIINAGKPASSSSEEDPCISDWENYEDNLNKPCF